MTHHRRRPRHLARAIAIAGVLAILAPGLALGAEEPEPTLAATAEPTLEPTAEPTLEPTPEPTVEPTLAPTSEPEPTDEPSAAVASILIATLDVQGTADPDDDVLLDGASYIVRADDGDGAFEDGDDVAVFGPEPAFGGLLDTKDLPAGGYWVVQAVAPPGYEPSAPVFALLNLDGTKTCAWDIEGPIECDLNDVGAEELSWTIVFVDNITSGGEPTAEPTIAPTAEPTAAGTGGVEGATGTPSLTLPPTDAGVTGTSSSESGIALALALLVAALIGASLLRPHGTHAGATGRRRGDE